MKKSQLLIGAVISGLVAGSTAKLSTASADHHEGKAKAEGKEGSCKGNSCKGKDHSCKGAKKGKKANSCKGAKKGAPADTTAPADAAAAAPAADAPAADAPPAKE